MKQHKVKFHNSKKAAGWKAKLLKQCRHNLSHLIAKKRGTVIDPGSEFRSAECLEPQFKHQRLWKKMRKIISSGVDYPLEKIEVKH